MARFLTYTTFAEGELERELKKLSPKSNGGSDVPAQSSQRLKSKLHDCAVTYPDGSAGICHYTRQGPRCHMLRYERGEPNQYGHGEYVARLYYLEAVARETASVEGVAQEKAAEAFQSAISQERNDASRLTPPGFGSRKADPALFTLSQKRAKELAGRYAICTRLEPSGKLLAVSTTFDTLEEANATWREKGDASLIVALCCRWARRWISVRFNGFNPARG